MDNQQERYDRQERIFGNDGQRRLWNTKIAIVGSGPIANFTSISLAAIGIGNIYIVDNSKKYEGFLYKLDPNKEVNQKYGAVRSLETVLSNFNPGGNYFGLHHSIVNERSSEFLDHASIIIDVTNDSTSKDILLGQKNKSGLIFASSKNDKGTLYSNLNHHVEGDNRKVLQLFKDYDGCLQDIVISEIMAGLVVDEVRKRLLPKDDDCKYVVYEINYKNKSKVDLNKKICIIGAGALGNFVGIGLAALGFKNLTIVDDDIVEITNLNRQVLFYDCVGRPKSECLVEKLRSINPKGGYVGIPKRLNSNIIDDTDETRIEDYEIVVCCVDNIQTRDLLNSFATMHGFALVNGATSPFEGEVEVYKPGFTACLDCQIKVGERATVEKEAQQKNSCVLAPDDSVVISNLVTGGLMVNAVRNVAADSYRKEKIMYSNYGGLDMIDLSANLDCECCQLLNESKELKEVKEATVLLHNGK